MSVLNSALSGLFLARNNLSTTSHNISNVNTEGFTRQEVVQSSAQPVFTTKGYIGNGVKIDNVRRAFVDLVNGQLIKNQASASFSEAASTQLSRINEVIGDEQAGVNNAFNNFFSASQDLTVRPTDPVSRGNFLSATRTFVGRVNTLNTVFEEVKKETSDAIKDSADAINRLTSEIAELNALVTLGTNRTLNGQQPNDLMDKRDFAISKLSEQIEITRTKNEDNTYSIFLQNGQPLVLNDQSYIVVAENTTADPTQISIGTIAKVSGEDKFIKFSDSALGKGRIGGLLKAQEYINEYQNTLGLVSSRFAESVNGILNSSFDLAGNPGGDLIGFTSLPTGSDGISRSVADALNSNPQIKLDVVPGSVNYSTIGTEDFDVYVDQAGAILVRPLGSISAGVPASFDPATNTFTVPNGLPAPHTGNLLQFTLLDQTGATLTAAALENGDNFVISPTRDAGRTMKVLIENPFELALSGSATEEGDNKGILGIVGLKNEKILFNASAGGGSSLLNAFNTMVGQVGTDKRELDSGLAAETALLEQITFEKNSVAGVNLDEEAANILKYQQAFQAAGQIIATEKSLFDGFISNIRG